MECLICNYKVKNFKSLWKHVFDKHKLNSQEYYDNYLKKPNEGICKVCKDKTVYINMNLGYHIYCSTKCQSNDPEMMKKKVLKNLGDNHWMRKSGKGNPNKGKTYEKIHGIEKATELKNNLSNIFLKNCVGEGNPFFGKHHNPQSRELIGQFRRGKTYEQIFGLEKGGLLRRSKIKIYKLPYRNVEYHSKFHDLSYRKRILTDQNYICPVCFCKLKKFHKNLHHINYVKKDNRRRNLIYLCIGCHATTNGDRDFWKAYLRRINREVIHCDNVTRRLFLFIEKQLTLENRQKILCRRIR